MMNSMKKEAMLCSTLVSMQPNVAGLFLRKLAQSRWAEAFVVTGDLLLEALLGDRARKTQKLTLISRISPEDAKTALDSLANDPCFSLNANAIGLNLEVMFNSAMPIRPQMREIRGAKIPCCPVEMLIVQEALSLSEGITKDNVGYLYDIATLADHLEIDGRILYESISQNVPCWFSAFIDGRQKNQPNWLLQCLYEYMLSSEGLSEPDFNTAVKTCFSMLSPPFHDVLKEQEFFGQWDVQTAQWVKYVVHEKFSSAQSS